MKSEYEKLATRFREMAKNGGLLDVRFSVSNCAEVATDYAEVNRLYEAVDRGEATPLDFGDSTHNRA